MGHRNIWTRRAVLGGIAAGAGLALAGCNNGLGANATQTLEGRVNGTLNELFTRYPNARPLVENARGVLVMPVMTQAGFGIGGSYGEGALRVGGQTVDFYSAAQASIGLQAGARQYAHLLVFQTDKALSDFRASPGWVAGAGAFYALPAEGMSYSTDTVTRDHPVVAMIFGETGVMAGAAIEGVKYTRIIPSSLAAR
ncbi:MAG: YSC84-related protein [Paracoccus sp. (in: a-proteobacteria)]|nr:YSC84-related protein [Paracoccus sp. (in: a-proteobacteria)]